MRTARVWPGAAPRTATGPVTGLACSSSNNNVPDGNDVSDADGGGDNGDQAQVKQLVWSQRVTVDAEQAGAQLSLAAMPDGENFAIAYFKKIDEVGQCTEPILGGPPTDVIQDRVRYAWSSGLDSWQHEDVATVSTVMITGISLVFDGSTPLVGYLGGTPFGGLQVCGGTDAIVARRTGAGSWTEDIAVAVSNEAAAGGDCPKMQAICDFGDVVGLWTTLARAPDGTIGLVYRDIHNGYTKEADDSSDLEYAYGHPGSWSHEWIDLARGAGDFPSLAFGPDDQPAVIYYNGEYGTLHFAKRPWAEWTQPADCTTADDCELGQTCGSGDCLCLTDDNCQAPLRCVGTESEGSGRCSAVIDSFANSLPENSLSLAVAPDGRYLVAYFDVDEKNLMIAYSSDGIDWTKGLIDANGSVGMYPSLVIDPQSGMPAVAYYRCSEYNPNELKCNRNEDGLYYAYFTGSYPDELTVQAKWKKSVVSQDSNAFDGMQAKAALLPDGRVGVAFLYAWYDNTQGQTQLNLMFRAGHWE